MTDRKAYLEISKLAECIKHKEHCLKQCSSCDFNIDKGHILEVLGYIQSILKARNPELYFAEELTELFRSKEELK